MPSPGSLKNTTILAGRRCAFSLEAISLALFLLASNGFNARAAETTPSPTIVDAAGEVDFELADSTGRLHRLSDARGQWVLINFWATWCAPCVTEIPVIRKFVKAHTSTLTAIGINFEEIDRAELETAIEELEIDYLVLQAGEAPILPFEPLKGLPSTFLVSPGGNLMFRYTGELSEQQLTDAYATALKSYSKPTE